MINIFEMKDITEYHSCLESLEWHGCYDSDIYFKQFVTPESYAHPAKASFLLIDRILKHLEKLELLKEGMTVADIMAGSGRIPLLASLKGYNTISVELEPHFIKMIEDNKKRAEKVTGRKLPMQIVQGDSRKLSSLLSNADIGVISHPYGLGEGIGHSGQPTQVVKDLKLQTRYGSSEGNIGNLPYVAVVSPPFEQSDNRGDSFNNRAYPELQRKKWDEWEQGYSDNSKNIGNLPYKEMVGITSPPYQDVNDHERPLDNTRNKNNRHNISLPYSQNPENIGNLKDTGSIVGITSPPYSEAEDRMKYKWQEGRVSAMMPYAYDKEHQIKSKDNIANLKDTSFVGITSPPYDNRLSDGGKDKEKWEQWHKLAIKKRETVTKYTDNIENIGNQNNQSYLSEMLKVYKEASKVCPIICTITKNPTRNKQLRRLDLDTKNLLELAGYKIVDYHRAMLFSEHKQQTLTGETKSEYKGRLSFFKRLSLQKGNVASMWEDVLIGVRK